ncbi:MAG: DUF7417 domain-containing protein [Candidatus Odinarchaeia archaeon]
MCKCSIVNWTDKVWAYEHGLLSSNQIVLLFSYLISSGEVFNLPDKYLETAQSLCDFGLISKEGKISWKKYYSLFEKK